MGLGGLGSKGPVIIGPGGKRIRGIGQGGIGPGEKKAGHGSFYPSGIKSPNVMGFLTQFGKSFMLKPLYDIYK